MSTNEYGEQTQRVCEDNEIPKTNRVLYQWLQGAIYMVETVLLIPLVPHRPSSRKGGLAWKGAFPIVPALPCYGGAW